jgi:nuclear pore complex protein Nup93
MQGRTVMNDIEMEFAKVVYMYNQKLIDHEKPTPDLLVEFVQLSQSINDKNIEEAWNMLYFMSNAIPSSQACELNRTESSSTSSSVNQSLTNTVKDRDRSPKMQIHFIKQAVRYLECCFREILQQAVNSNLKQAKLGGAPGTLALVTAYMRIPQSEKYHASYEETLDEQQPLWPLLYLCLRCGDIEAARTVAVKARKEDIAGYLDELIQCEQSNQPQQRHLSVSNENKLKLEYKSRIKKTADTYKRAVYCYLCRYSGDNEGMSEVLDNVEDFLWFKLNSVVVTSNSNSDATTSTDHLEFSEFQTKMSIEYGEKHFIANRNPFIYLQVLILTGQFEMAIEFLLKFE